MLSEWTGTCALNFLQPGTQENALVITPALLGGTVMSKASLI